MRFAGIIILVIAVTVVANAQSQWVEVISVKANLRGTPDSKGVIVAEVESGDRFQVLKHQGAWYLVQTPKYIGWLNGNTIRLVQPTPPPVRYLTPAIPSGPPTGFIRSPDDAEKYVPAPDTVTAQWLESDKDQGYDLGYVTVDRINLRDTPSKYGEIVKTLARGDVVVILDRKRSDNWLNVIDLDSAKEGWVFVSHMHLYYSSKPKPPPPAFEATYSNDREHEPVVTVTNDSDRTMALKISGSTYTIAPYATKVLYFSGGTYKFFASAPRTLPLSGDEAFSRGYDYKWTFYIETVHVP